MFRIKITGRSESYTASLLVIWFLVSFLLVPWLAANRFGLALSISPWALFLIGGCYTLLTKFPDAWEANAGFLPKSSGTVVYWSGLLIPLFLFWTVFHHALGSWWAADDPEILHYLDSVGPVAGFFDPDSRYNFYAPMQGLSLGLDYWLFGLEPEGFYIHHLVSFSLAIMLAYNLLARIFSPVIASATMILFLASVPVSEAANWLMVRHYVEGMLLSLIAVWLYMQAVTKQLPVYGLAGAMMYLLAAMAKEIYVPLLFVLPLIPLGSVSQRLRVLPAFVIALLVYTGLRFYMLRDGIFSGYQEQSTSFNDIVNLPGYIGSAMGWESGWQIPGIIAGLVLIALAILHRGRSIGPVVLILTALSVLPLYPVFWRLPSLSYYLLVFAFFISLGVAFGTAAFIQQNDRKHGAEVLLPAMVLIFLLVNLLPSLTRQQYLLESMNNQRLPSEYLLAAEQTDTVLIYDSPFANDLVYLREHVLGRSEDLYWCPQNDCLCGSRFPSLETIEWVNGIERRAEVSGASCSTSLHPLTATVTFTPPGSVAWQFGPYPDSQGTYTVMSTISQFGELLRQPTVLQVGSTGSHSFPGEVTEPFGWTIKFASNEGWETASGELTIDPGNIGDDETIEILWGH